MTENPSALDLHGYAEMLDAIGKTFTPEELAEIARLSEALRRKVEGDGEASSVLTGQVSTEPSIKRPEVAERCDMGVGCDELGVCYAAAQGQPERCSLATSDPAGGAE